MIDVGDILLFGCNIAESESGELFIRTLSEILGAKVSASDDLTGAIELKVD